MPARRCAIDGINYPNDSTYNKCPICGEHTAQRWNEEPDVNWQGKVEEARQRRLLAEEAEEAIPSIKGDLPIYEEHGLFWVDQGDLIRAGYRRNSQSPSFWVFVANGQYWEAQAWHESERRWWIESLGNVEDGE